jgi:membrane-associated HD superfamily phosphohydrolase
MTGFIRTISILLFIFSASIMVQAQFDTEVQNGRKKEELSQNIKETLAKQRIEEEKKEFQELIEKGDKAVKMSEDLKKSYTKNNKLTSQDKDKLKDLEKLLKKIRKDLGGDNDDEESEDKPISMATAINILADTTVNLYQEIKKTSRYSISAVAIKSSNTILSIVKFLRFSK